MQNVLYLSAKVTHFTQNTKNQLLSKNKLPIKDSIKNKINQLTFNILAITLFTKISDV
jgi:hypothetical protein